MAISVVGLLAHWAWGLAIDGDWDAAGDGVLGMNYLLLGTSVVAAGAAIVVPAVARSPRLVLGAIATLLVVGVGAVASLGALAASRDGVSLGPAAKTSPQSAGVQDDRHRPVVHELDLHPRAEDAGLDRDPLGT